MPKMPLPPTLDPKNEALKAKRLAAQADRPKPVSRIKHSQRPAVSEKINARVAREQDLVATLRAQSRTADSDPVAEARLYIELHDLERPRARVLWTKPLARLITGEQKGGHFNDVWNRILCCLMVAKCEGVNVTLHHNSEPFFESEYKPMSPEQRAAKWRTLCAAEAASRPKALAHRGAFSAEPLPESSFAHPRAYGQVSCAAC